MNLLLRYLKTEQLTNQRTNGTQKKAITKDPVGGKFGVKNRENYLDTKKPVESLEWYILLQIFSTLQTKSITSSQISLEYTLGSRPLKTENDKSISDIHCIND